MEQFKINAIAHLILDHLSGIHDYFEAAIGTTNDAEMEINMFHAIDDLAAEIFGIIEKYKDVDDWQEYRKKLGIPLSMDRKFHPVIYNGIDIEELLRISKQNEQIHTEVLKKLKSHQLFGRWSQIRSLKRELDLFNKYHII
ncbi:MAG: hypothetical protein K2Y14_12430 [Burkholderiales bacterium]|nr:hypothetical protein [Burkholderiales bacterium]